MSFQRHSHTLTVWWARLSFPHVWEPQPIKKRGKLVGDPRYSCLVVLDPKINAAAIQQIQRIEKDLIEKSWGGNPPGKVLPALKHGEEIRPNDANLKGKMVLSANAKLDSPPQVHEQMPDGNYRLTNERSLIYSGCEAHVNVGLYTDDLSDMQVCTGLNVVIPTKRILPRFDNRPTIESIMEEQIPDAPPVPEGGETPVREEWDRRTSFDRPKEEKERPPWDDRPHQETDDRPQKEDWM